MTNIETYIIIDVNNDIDTKLCIILFKLSLSSFSISFQLYPAEFLRLSSMVHLQSYCQVTASTQQNSYSISYLLDTVTT